METAQKTLTTTWAIDQSHSHIKFVARHMVISKVTGQFEEYSLDLKTDGNDFEDAEIKFKAKIDSINTGKEDRDNHLKSDDFFNAAEYPELLFKSTSIKKIDDDEFELKGNLTIRDVTKPINLKVTYGGLVKDPYGLERAGFHVSGKINRFDYGLKWNALLETGGAVVSENIVIDSDIEIVKQ